MSSLEEYLQSRVEQRKKKAKRVVDDGVNVWVDVDNSKNKYEIIKIPVELNWTIWTIRHTEQSPVTLLKLFLSFITKELLERIIKDVKDTPKGFSYSAGTDEEPKHRQVDARAAYETLAVQIRIIGLQNAPSESECNEEPLRDAIMEALDYFGKKGYDTLGINKTEMLVSRLLITARYARELSDNFRSLVDFIGRFVAGDEKLYHFTGQGSGQVRLCFTKPDRIGHWFYELVVTVKCGLQFILYYRLHDGNPFNGPLLATEIVDDWSAILCSPKGRKSDDIRTMVFFDSLYFTQESRRNLNRDKVPYIASIDPARLSKVTDYLKDKLSKEGEWKGVYSPSTQETCIHVWDMNQNIGKKHCFSNSFTQTPRYNHAREITEDPTLIPVYDTYSYGFSACDHFNRMMHDRRWPHKRGGRDKKGDDGNHHNFALIITLLNVFAAYNDICALGREYEYKAYCLTLADKLFEYAQTL